MELHLDRKLAERRIFPAIDIRRSGTRREEMLLTQEELDKVWAIRKSMNDSFEFVDQFLKKMKNSENNEQFLMSLDIASDGATIESLKKTDSAPVKRTTSATVRKPVAKTTTSNSSTNK